MLMVPAGGAAAAGRRQQQAALESGRPLLEGLLCDNLGAIACNTASAIPCSCTRGSTLTSWAKRLLTSGAAVATAAAVVTWLPNAAFQSSVHPMSGSPCS